jgi:hypothetical protein
MTKRIALQVGHGAEVRLPARVIAQHPADVRKPEAAARAIRIAHRIIDVSVVSAMTGTPNERAVLKRHRAEKQIDELERRMRFVSGVGEQRW